MSVNKHDEASLLDGLENDNVSSEQSDKDEDETVLPEEVLEEDQEEVISSQGFDDNQGSLLNRITEKGKSIWYDLTTYVGNNKKQVKIASLGASFVVVLIGVLQFAGGSSAVDQTFTQNNLASNPVPKTPKNDAPPVAKTTNIDPKLGLALQPKAPNSSQPISSEVNEAQGQTLSSLNDLKSAVESIKFDLATALGQNFTITKRLDESTKAIQGLVSDQKSISAELSNIRSNNVELSKNISSLRDGLVTIRTKGEYNEKDLDKVLASLKTLESNTLRNNIGLDNVKTNITEKIDSFQSILMSYDNKMDSLGQRVKNATYIASVPNKVTYKDTGASITTVSDNSGLYPRPTKEEAPIEIEEVTKSSGELTLTKDWTISGVLGDIFVLVDFEGREYHFPLGQDLGVWGTIDSYIPEKPIRLITSAGYMITNAEGQAKWQTY